MANTDRRRRAFDALKMLEQPATMREVAAAAGFRSPATAQRAMEELRDLGLVEWRAKKARTLRLTEAGRVAR
jgi:SOS-response transcriptional repressor LexA